MDMTASEEQQAVGASPDQESGQTGVRESFFGPRTQGPVQRKFPPMPTAVMPTNGPGHGQRFTASPPAPAVTAPPVAAAVQSSSPPSPPAVEPETQVLGETHKRRRNSISERISALAGGVVRPAEPRAGHQLRT
jgi:hypothetical protein